MDPGVATCPISLQIQPKWLRLGLGSGELKNPSLFLPHAGRLSFSRKWKHLCLRGEGNFLSSWDEKPYEILPGGRISYLDEQDIATFVDPPKELIPLDPESYNPAAYLWKKLGDIPEERRHRLLASLNPKHIPKVWELTGTRYQDAKLAKQTASTLLSMDANSMTPEYWRCRTSKGPMPFSWLNDFKKAIFRGKDGGTYGRIILKYMKQAGWRLGLVQLPSTCQKMRHKWRGLAKHCSVAGGRLSQRNSQKSRVWPWKQHAVDYETGNILTAVPNEVSD